MPHLFTSEQRLASLTPESRAKAAATRKLKALKRAVKADEDGVAFLYRPYASEAEMASILETETAAGWHFLGIRTATHYSPKATPYTELEFCRRKSKPNPVLNLNPS